ncbi:uncharacterized protein LOC116097021 [Mastomys coucha]|uniref:uncharacterized protein LOC116097021 n=1 Tax=Mastomys coucha TaxID=35658 RepID=UPI0012627F5F|nr:uncharacterized protein LOC116097021 [Mastomys coucha]
MEFSVSGSVRCSKTERLGPAFHTCVDECACGCVRACVCVCARRGRAWRAAGKADAPGERLTRRLGGGTVRPGDPPRPEQAATIPLLLAGRAVAYTRLGRSTLQAPPLPAKRASLQLGPSDPPFLAPGGLGRQRSATSLTPCGTTPPPGRVGCGLPRDLHPSLVSPGFHQASTFSLRGDRGHKKPSLLLQKQEMVGLDFAEQAHCLSSPLPRTFKKYRSQNI